MGLCGVLPKKQIKDIWVVIKTRKRMSAYKL